MDATVRVLFADPEVALLEEDRDVWIVSGVDAERLLRGIEDAETLGAVRTVVGERAEDAVLVHVEVGSNGVRAVDAYRSVVSNRELYYGRTTDDVLFLTDQYRNALAQRSADDRTLADTAVTDHLLFRAPIEPTTYVEEISAVEHGSWIHWGKHATEPSVSQVDRLTGASDGGDAPVSTLDDVLGRVLRRGTGEATRTNMLSGGVDSTLLQTYLGDDAEAVVLEPDAPELEFEVEYAADAASHLGIQPRSVPFAEAEYLDQLETSVVELGFPSHYGLTAAMDAAFATDRGERYVNGEGADALFGLTGVKGFRAATRFEPVLNSPIGGLARSAPDPVGSYASQLSQQAERSHRPPWDPRSFAQQFAFFTDPDVAEAFVGVDRVAARSKRQYEYVTERVDSKRSGRYARHIELGHLLSFYRHNTVNQWRQLAFARGNSMFAPFKTRSMASFALSVPAERRYASDHLVPQRMVTKHLPKRLLHRRLPAYDTEKRKGGGAYPRERFFEDGCLQGVFERYEPPEFVPERLYADHVESYGPLTWNLITFAIWRDLVLENDGLDPVAGSTEVRCGNRITVDVL